MNICRSGWPDTEYRKRPVQKQLLCITRLMLCHPAMLILDEATSALDNESERFIQQSLEELAKDKKKRQKFGEYARTTSLNYSSDVVTKEWIALLKRKA